MPKIIRLEYVDIKIAEHLLTEFKQTHAADFQDWQITLIKTPHQSYTIEEDPILVMNEHGLSKPINEMSVMINAISDKYENTAFLCIDSAIIENTQVKLIVAKFTEGMTATQAE
jgi:hypothetical protein